MALTASQADNAADPRLLDTRIMAAHYSLVVLFWDTARRSFASPDLSAIPQAAI